MINKKNIDKGKLFFLIPFLFSTSLLSLRSLKKVDIQDIKIHGGESLSKTVIVENSSLDFPTRLIFIKTKYIEKELKKNLSLENVSVNREIIPFGLKFIIKTRKPIAYGEKSLNGKNISGFIDQNGFFINKKYADKSNLDKLSIQVFGWQEKFKKTLSKILISQKNDEIELIKITFSPNGFLSLEEKDLKTILMGSNQNLISIQLQVIRNLKYQLKNNSIYKDIDNIDITDPENPKIKVFKP